MAIDREDLQQAVIRWYQRHGRKDLPWQQSVTPYRVWLSEIMLQQTQVKTVIPYFDRFIKRFPTVKELALADIDEVTHLWAGLGYYSRARNLHKTAQLVYQQYQGEFPSSVAELEALPGIGRSTAGAILALSRNQFAPILDGNVKRVLTRAFCIAGWPEKSDTKKQLWQLATELTPLQQINAYTQAMMDIGALLCTRSKPNCSDCPLTPFCQARKTNAQHLYPEKKPKRTLPNKQTFMLLLDNGSGQLLVEKRPPTGIWGGLWSLPEVTNEKAVEKFLEQRYGLIAKQVISLPAFKHTFSHFHLNIQPLLIHCEASPARTVMETSPTLWYNDNQHKLGFPKPVQQLINDHLQGAHACHE